MAIAGIVKAAAESLPQMLKGLGALHYNFSAGCKEVH